MKRNIWKGSFFIALTLIIVFFSGCSDLVQIEDRDFLLGLAISYEEDEYKVILQQPDLKGITGQEVPDEKELLATYAGKSISKIKEQYAKHSEKRLDFSHLKAIILDEKLVDNKLALKQFLRYVENDYEISRNTLIFYTSDNINDISGKIGEVIENIYQNNPSNMDIRKVTIGDIINCLYQPDRVIVFPKLDITKKDLSINGATIFQNIQYKDKLTEEELTVWNMLQGKGAKRSIPLPSGEVIRLKEIRTKYKYGYTKDSPYIEIFIEGEAEMVEEEEGNTSDLQKSMNVFLQSDIIQQINEKVKEKKIDYANFYRKMSYKNRNMWRIYEGKQEEFLDEVTIFVNVKMGLEKP